MFSPQREELIMSSRKLGDFLSDGVSWAVKNLTRKSVSKFFLLRSSDNLVKRELSERHKEIISLNLPGFFQ